MPRRLRRPSGQDVIDILGRFGFVTISQNGSHAKLRRIGPRDEKQTLVVSLHGELDRGTVRTIVRQASAYIPIQDLEPHFYTE